MKLYVVRNKEGKFFKNKGYGGYGSNWKDNLDQAKFYPKIGQAKSRCTFFAKAYPKFGVCEILEFDLNVGDANVINVEADVAKSIKKAEEKELERQRKNKEWEIERLQREKQSISQRLNRLRS